LVQGTHMGWIQNLLGVREEANFHEKAHSVKAAVAAPLWSSATAVPFAMLPSALSVSSLFGDSVHYEIRLFGLIRCCNLRIGLSSQVDQVRIAQSPLEIRSDRARSRGTSATLASLVLCQDLHFLFFSFPDLHHLSLS
jgi:hypothetical protein